MKETNRRKYTPTPFADRLIRDAYQRQRKGDRAALKVASHQIGWSRTAICKRGAELGITRVKERGWSVAEEEVLEQFGYLSPARIKSRLENAGYSRSIAAIQVKLNRNRIKSNLDGYSACGLADAFGVDVHKVLIWIRRGLLRAERRGTQRTVRQGGDTWWIPRREVRRFVLRAPEEIDLARVEKIWFLDLLAGNRLAT